MGTACCGLNERLTKHCSQPLAVAISSFDFMKRFQIFAVLAPASGG
jgi:hypothetical protein